MESILGMFSKVEFFGIKFYGVFMIFLEEVFMKLGKILCFFLFVLFLLLILMFVILS